MCLCTRDDHGPTSSCMVDLRAMGLHDGGDSSVAHHKGVHEGVHVLSGASMSTTRSDEEDNSVSTTCGDRGRQLWWARVVQRHPEADKCSPTWASHRLPPVASETLPRDAVALVEAAVAPWGAVSVVIRMEGGVRVTFVVSIQEVEGHRFAEARVVDLAYDLRDVTEIAGGLDVARWHWRLVSDTEYSKEGLEEEEGAEGDGAGAKYALSPSVWVAGASVPPTTSAGTKKPENAVTL
ncbi:hypothetical protein FB451DRAFT_1429532 [Mycena latifolia]|nr:hypothetical protein FB451DRAFT_1429532 [Mycena latifolia]